MSFRTNPDRILDHIDRERNRDEAGGSHFSRDASARELDTEVPSLEATSAERLRRLFKIVERAYMTAAQSTEMRKLAARFQAIGDISTHHARGDVSVSVQYLDHERPDDVGVSPFEVVPDDLVEARKATRTSRADANAMKVLRQELRDGVMAAYKKMEPRLRDGVRERADMGHVGAQVTIDLRPGS